MASRKAEVVRVGEREVTVTNPDKVYFPRAGHTKLDLVRYYLAVAEGALVGVRDRPMALKRFVDGAEGEPFFQKRAPEKRPDFVRVATLAFPSGRTADEIVIDDAAGLAWVNNLGCIDLNPHPVRSADLEHPDELRVDLDPVPGVPWSQIRDVALVVREALADVGLVGWPKTSGSRGIHVNVRIEPRWTFPQVRRAALAIARDVERRAPTIATSKWWKEERHGVFLDYNQNAKDRTVASVYSVRPTPDARVSMPLAWDDVAAVEPEDFTLATVPALFAERGDPGAGIDAAVGSLEALLELSARHEAEGQGDAPWPPNYRKQAGEPPRVQPSKQRRPATEYDTPEAEAEREKARAAMERRMAAWEREREERRSGAGSTPTRPTPTGRRRSSIPVIEIARAKRKEEAMEGLQRWKARWPKAAAALEDADVLVDAMRGRSTTWTRIRVNLVHVPEGDRPPQEPLDPDYDPWVEWEAPDRSGQLERPKRRGTDGTRPDPTEGPPGRRKSR
jgi:DNA ligase D-like protein (predicted polymerase)